MGCVPRTPMASGHTPQVRKQSRRGHPHPPSAPLTSPTGSGPCDPKPRALPGWAPASEASAQRTAPGPWTSPATPAEPRRLAGRRPGPLHAGLAGGLAFLLHRGRGYGALCPSFPAQPPAGHTWGLYLPQGCCKVWRPRPGLVHVSSRSWDSRLDLQEPRPHRAQ